MNQSAIRNVLVVAPLGIGLLAGCQNLPGTEEQQGAVAGGAAGAVVGEAAGDSVLSTLLGGALGAGAGYLLGANKDKLLGEDSSRDEAREAVEDARRDPATPAEVADADTADLNDDGFVTMDEVIAMEEAGLDDDTIVDRLQATDQVFELNRDQQTRLVDAGVSPSVVAEMNEINRDERERLRRRNEDIISADPETT